MSKRVHKNALQRHPPALLNKLFRDIDPAPKTKREVRLEQQEALARYHAHEHFEDYPASEDDLVFKRFD